MRWEDLQPGDQLLPYKGYRSDVLDRELDPMIVLSVVVKENNGKQVSKYGDTDVVEIQYLNMRTAATFKETRYASGTAGLGYEIVRAGERVA
jgi:hypothetical protein